MSGKPKPERPMNAFSVDVEDYFQVRSFASMISRSSWDSYESRFSRNTREILELLARMNTTCTFFVLGWNAEKDPGLVREMKAAGHEIASHGWSHTLVYEQSRSRFREEVLRTKSVLEDISGSAVVGFRAPSYSIIQSSMWALEVLAETGHMYDSSIYPIRRGVYGIPSSRREPHMRRAGDTQIAEFPMSTARLGRWNMPFGSGAYLRITPLWITRALLDHVNRQGMPVIVSIHPWELDPEQPRICPFFRRPNHYLCLRKALPKLRALLKRYDFVPVKDALKNLKLLPEHC